MLVVENAEKKVDLSFVSKANALKRKANETKQDIEELEERYPYCKKNKKDSLR